MSRNENKISFHENDYNVNNERKKNKYIWSLNTINRREPNQ